MTSQLLHVTGVMFAIGVLYCAVVVWLIVSFLRAMVMVDDSGFVVRFLFRKRILWTDLLEVRVAGNGFGWGVKVRTTSRWPWFRWLPVGSNSFGRPRDGSQPVLLARSLEAHRRRAATGETRP